MKEIKSKSDFINNLKNLSASSREWENNYLDSFLEAMIAYAEDIQGYYNNTNQNIDSKEASWQVFYDIIKGATIYE